MTLTNDPPVRVWDDFERQPPHDPAAEQSVLGGILLSKDAIADVVEMLGPQDFYRPAHTTIYHAVLDLYGRGEPADPVTVAAALDRTGALQRVGGAAYLVTLTQAVPTAANAGYYAEIVAEKATLRRLVEAGTRIVQYGYAGADGLDIAEVVDRSQAEIFQVGRRSSDDVLPLEALLQPTMDEMDLIATRGGRSAGVRSGFVELDDLTNGFHPGQMIVVAGRPGHGKALALETPLPTPTGWTTMACVQVGDELLDAQGRPTRVVATTPVMTGRPCWEVEFCDGTVIVADDQHQWITHNDPNGLGDKPSRVRTTGEIAAALQYSPKYHQSNHAVSATAPLRLPHQDLPVSPYTMGTWLGDRLSGNEFRPGGTEVVALRSALRTLGVLDHPHIPPQYLRASLGQRRQLLAGLLDTVGTIDGSNAVMDIAVTDSELTRDIEELVVSLGLRFSVCPAAAEDTKGAVSSRRLTFTADETELGFTQTLPISTRRTEPTTNRVSSRFIVAVRPIASVPVRCVQVDNAEHLYLASRSMIPTHNSTLAMDFLRACSIDQRRPGLFFSLEMSKTEITMRLLSAETSVRLADMRGGRLTDRDWTNLATRMADIADAPLYIDDSANMTMTEIRAKCRRLKQKHDELGLIVIDYLQLMTTGKRAESRQTEVSELSRNIKLLAKEIQTPVIALSQLNRGPEQRADKRPMVSDLRESGAIEQDCDVAILLHRFAADDLRAGETDLIVGKHRNGPTATIVVANQLHMSRFVDLPRGR